MCVVLTMCGTYILYNWFGMIVHHAQAAINGLTVHLI